MQILYFVLYLLAAVAFALDSFGVVVRRFNFLSIGLFFLALVLVLQSAHRL